MSEQPIFSHCPLECPGALESTGILLPEGRMRRCPSCGQLLSACTPSRFTESMREFNVPRGTLPQGKAMDRHRVRVGTILKTAARLTGKESASLSLLDVGCSSGSVLQVACDLGFKPAGVEPAAEAANTARQQGFEVFTGYLQDARFPEQQFDIVTLFEVIEHLENPLALVREIRRILKPGGIFVIGTGNGESWTAKALGSRWSYFSIGSHGGHISFFNPRSIRYLAERTGFTVAAIQAKRVLLAEKDTTPGWLYRPGKLLSEALSLPARWLNRGHDMTAFLQAPRD